MTIFFFSSRRRHTRWPRDWSSDVCSSDLSQSVKNSAVAVKSHHNVGGLPEDMKLELLEPLKDLFKDDVRKVGIALGLPEEMVNRHPFPGPGLGIRILGENKEEKIRILQEADNIFIEEIDKNDRSE